MHEIVDYAGLILPIAAGLGLAILSTRLTQRTAIPAPAVLLVGGAVASDLSPAIEDAISVQTVERIAVVALIVILFDGGMDIGWRRFRSQAGAILSIGVLGTFITAAVVAGGAHWILGLSWTTAGLLGAALAPTDPAVTFSVLGQRAIRGSSKTTLEGEAGVNDPAGIALMLGMVELATHPDASAWVVAREFAVAMGIGAAAGAFAGPALTMLLGRLRLESPGLYPVLALVTAGVVYGATSLAHGSGFLAVFLAGLWLGDARVTREAGIRDFHGAMASLSELVVFLALGLSIDIGSLDATVWRDGAVLALALAIVARPLAVAATLPGFGLTPREKLFMSWSGLKGAVPILLAAFAVIGGVEGAERVYGIVFVVVLASVVGQGSFVPAIARALGITREESAPDQA